MPAKSKKQQRFMGMVHATQKGEKPASAAVAKVAKSIKKKDAEDFASTKHKGLPMKKKKTETKVRNLIRKMVREIMREGAGGMGPAKNVKQSTVSLRHKTSEKEISVTNSKSVLQKYKRLGYLPYNPKDKYKYGSLKWKAPKMKGGVVVEDFAGAHPKEKRDKFDKMRQKQSEVLGYKLTGTSDVKTEIGDATIKEGKVNVNDLKYQLDVSLEDRGINPKALRKMKKVGRDYSLYMASYMSQGSMDKVIKNINKSLRTKLKIKKQKKGSMGIEYIIGEAKKRDYKAEYKKFQSSDKSKKYRAELNAYNRKKGTYGNGDGKDASHKGGKIAGFEKESVNRGRAEKSRLKKEGKLTESPKADRLRKRIEVVMGTLLKKLGIKSSVSNVSGSGGMSFFLDDTKEAKKLKKELEKRIKDVRIINLDKKAGDWSNHVVYAKLFEGKITEGIETNQSLILKMKKISDFKKYWADPDQRKDVYYKNVPVKLFKRYFKLNPRELQHIDMDNINVMRNGKVDLYNEGKINEAQEPLWTKDTVKDAIKQIKKGLKNAVPYLDDIGTGFGGKSIIGKISLDKKNTWPNGILHNSRWALIHFFPDGTLDTIRMSGWRSYEERKKVPILRKSKNKTLKQAIDRMGRYFTVVRTKYPVKGK